MRIKKGDTVKVLYGRYAGKTGKVVLALAKRNMVVVEGVNVYKRHIKGDGQTRKSEIVDITKPMPVSKVQLVNEAGKATRVAYKVVEGKKTRVAVKGGKTVESAKAVEGKAKAETKSETKPAKKAKATSAKKVTKKKSTAKK
ncbi:MAG: hypothetical protein Fur003_4750 [Candidatus Dojkabacteria bacterium]